ncbi:restriction endonuclease subunit S [Alteromonas flava]|uniref:restriction endonuclease subunit S n=1 Tax=Alteromonas flava TaxID=2048003 RepID=UPI000C289913|nr:restriction endonuclease subunit S [Alteromonas flava]
MSSNGTSPILRFSEFTCEYKIYKLGQITEIKSASRVLREQWQDSGVPFFRSSDVVAAHKMEKNKKVYIAQELFEELSSKSGRLKKNDLLVTGGGSIGIPYLVKSDEPLYFKDADLICFKSNKTIYGPYLYQFFLSPTFRQYLRKITHTGTISHFTIEQGKATPIRLPATLEQKKIAEFLCKVDKKISLLKEKHALLEQYKKGVMQKLFKQEIRFKDNSGNEFPDWQSRRFEEVFVRITRKNKEDNQNVLTISAQMGLVNQEKYFNKSVSAKDLTGYYLLENGDFAYNKSYSKGYPMGAIKRLNNYDKGVVSTLYICFRVVGEQEPLFWEQFFEAGLLNREINKIAQEGARNHGLLNVSVTEFFNDIEVPVPSRAEQRKIADFLCVLDKKLNSVKEQIELTQTFKKGLLQQMFV